ncbi:penicillin-binding protein 4 [Shouchella clausii]|uniref:transglycosylase domain-containing protein n=1 Tax=Shouchella clausii TaxID=79880 RepID=UPI00079B00F3|nr:transglycosylase domain-containing protein [Shouchella clausii]KKI88130.1 hypothetical protein WZ76_01595 [Shouchella clausii]PAD46889.1 penicillin-binding protein [Shouchella clausii]GIN16501.1 penicillin-binding protein 4 [Shouchella clausii]
MKTGTGWILIAVLALSTVFLFSNVTAEITNVQSVRQIVNEHIDRDALYLSSNSTIVDANGRTFAELNNGTNRVYLPYSDIPETVIHAFIATEDKRFFEHHGFDATGIARAFLANASEGGIDQGASTITQQMVRNIFLDHSRTYERKVSELLYAYELEQQYSKEEILELYLNSIYFGNGAYGVEAAAQLYFSETTNQLSLAQIAFLTAIPNNPTYYDPFKDEAAHTHERKEWVLQKMEEEGFITSAEHNEALEESIVLHRSQLKNEFPDYSDFILAEFKMLIRQLENMEEAPSEEVEARVNELLKQGVTIETALDPDRQQRLVDSVVRELPDNAQGAAMVIDNDKRTIVAISNGRGYERGNLMYATQSFRHHGSAFKPLIDYVPYLEETGASLTATFNGNPSPNCAQNSSKQTVGCVNNYNHAMPGVVTMREAFKHSYNVPAEYMLAQVGVEKALSYLEPFSFSKLNDEERGLALALGTVDVSVYEMAQAYSTFAHDGKFAPAHGIVRVVDEHGETLYQWDDVKEVLVWSKETNDKMRTLLADVIASGTGKGITLGQSGYIGGKTGTSSQYRDLAFSGLTDKYTASVWVGRDEGSVEDLSPRRPAMNIWETAVRE